MELVFNIQGEFITQTARDWFYLERKPFEKVKELLLSCMCGTDISKEKLNQYVEDILKFKRKFIGETKDNTFCLVEDNEKNEIVKNYEDIKNYGKTPFERCEYGFINPEGKYIPVSWSNHSEWASNYLKDNLSKKEWLLSLNEYNCNSTDILVKKFNWILIDNPQQGRGIVQTGEKITKAQKETLFDYYIFFNRKSEATKLYKEEIC